MATFHLNQAVKIISWKKHPYRVGTEGIVRSFDVPSDSRITPGCNVGVEVKGYEGGIDGLVWFRPSSLVPLTDPKAEAFIENIKKLCEKKVKVPA